MAFSDVSFFPSRRRSRGKQLGASGSRWMLRRALGKLLMERDVEKTGWWFEYVFVNLYPYLGKSSKLINIFQMGCKPPTSKGNFIFYFSRDMLVSEKWEILQKCFGVVRICSLKEKWKKTPSSWPFSRWGSFTQMIAISNWNASGALLFLEGSRREN